MEYYSFRYLVMKVLSCYIFKEIMNDQITALYLMLYTQGQASNEWSMAWVSSSWSRREVKNLHSHGSGTLGLSCCCVDNLIEAATECAHLLLTVCTIYQLDHKRPTYTYRLKPLNRLTVIILGTDGDSRSRSWMVWFYLFYFLCSKASRKLVSIHK